MLGLTFFKSSYPIPSLSMTPGLKFSTTASDVFASFLSAWTPFSCLRSRTMLFLLRLTSM